MADDVEVTVAKLVTIVSTEVVEAKEVREDVDCESDIDGEGPDKHNIGSGPQEHMSPIRGQDKQLVLLLPCNVQEVL